MSGTELEPESDDDLPGLVDVSWRLEPPMPPEQGRPCHECGRHSEDGQSLGSTMIGCLHHVGLQRTIYLVHPTAPTCFNCNYCLL